MLRNGMRYITHLKQNNIMKKLKDLKENECIHISTKREARHIKHLSNCSHKVKLMVGMYFYKVDRINVIVHGITDSYTVYPASDFIRPSVKEQLRQLSDRVGKLEANTMPVVDEQHVKELTEPPEKWAIAINKDTYKLIKNNLVSSLIKDYGYFNYNMLSPSQWFACNGVQNGYTEITFEQFEKWVLKSKQSVVGTWRKNPNADYNQSLYYIESVDTDKEMNPVVSYGFSKLGKWSVSQHRSDSILYWTEAPHAEVEAALIGEAKRLGFRTGRVVTTENTFKFVGEFKYYPENNTLYLGMGRIFNNGNWTGRYGFAVTRGAGVYVFRADTDINGANACNQIAGWDFTSSSW